MESQGSGNSLAATAETEAERGRTGSGFCLLLFLLERSPGQSSGHPLSQALSRSSWEPWQSALPMWPGISVRRRWEAVAGDQSEMLGKDSDPKAVT